MIHIIIIVFLYPSKKVPFVFQIDYFTERTGGMHIQFCDIKRDYQHAYFLITMAYIFVIMLLPIIIIFVSNTFIITRILHVNRQREKMFLESYCMVMSPRDSKAHASLVAVERDLKIMKRSSEPITHSTQNSRIKKFKRSSIENLRLDEIDHPTIDNFVKQANSVVHKASQVCHSPNLNYLLFQRFNNILKLEHEDQHNAHVHVIFVCPTKSALLHNMAHLLCGCGLRTDTGGQ